MSRNRLHGMEALLLLEWRLWYTEIIEAEGRDVYKRYIKWEVYTLSRKNYTRQEAQLPSSLLSSEHLIGICA